MKLDTIKSRSQIQNENRMKGGTDMEEILCRYPFREAQYDRLMTESEARLLPYKTDGHFTGRDQRSIHYITYVPSSPSAVVAVCHSSGESAVKYLEFASFFFDMGFKVCLFDFRGHGESWRAVSNRSVTHVDSFDDYVNDLADCIDRHAPSELPLFIFGCGMGGAVALRYLQLNPKRAAKACLLAPLVAYKLPSPEGLNRLRLARAVKKDLKWELCPGSECYRPHEVFSGSNYRSFARFAWYRALRAADTRLQNSAVSLGWLNALLENSDKLYSARQNRKIETELLICEAGKDEILPPDALSLLRSRLPGSAGGSKRGAGLVCFSEARHDIQNSEQKTLSDLMKLLYVFFGGAH